MKTSDIFIKATASRINEAIEQTFGQKLKLENYTLDQLHDARNRLRTQVHQYKQSSSFNETVENEAFIKSQWMLDAINAEIGQREEFSVDAEESTIEEDASIESQGDEMNTQVKESATDKAGAVVAAKTMVDRVSRWIEELAGMENDQLLDLGDTIRDEMGQEQAKAYLSSVAPAIQQALETLKQTRETLSSGVRSLTGEAQPEEMLGADPTADQAAPPEGFGDEEAGLDDFGGEAGPDELNAAPEDDFAASEPAIGGAEEAGRAKRESIDRSHNLLKVLAG